MAMAGYSLRTAYGTPLQLLEAAMGRLFLVVLVMLPKFYPPPPLKAGEASPRYEGLAREARIVEFRQA
jgi:hypothetical protein